MTEKAKSWLISQFVTVSILGVFLKLTIMRDMHIPAFVLGGVLGMAILYSMHKASGDFDDESDN